MAMLNAVDMADTVIAVSGEGDTLLPVALRYAQRVKRQIARLDAASLGQEWGDHPL